MSGFNERIIDEFRGNAGKVGGPFEGATLLILHTTGAKSGEPREAPVMYFDEPEGLFVVASKAGTPEHPAWFHNLKADPHVHVEQAVDSGIREFDATAEPVEEELRDILFARISARAPGFAAYQHKTERVIPVVRITAS